MIETVPSGTILQGRYRIERVLGSGGFGHVYLAIDLDTSQLYALKEYLVSGSSGQEQLRHEANVLGQLHHPSLPAFHNAFNERGRYYVVLNYIEGHDLTDLIRMARQKNDIIPIARILQWLLSICDAVLFLHNQHPPVIHRDIKPDNIRITSNGTAILVDLGNAKEAADGVRTLLFIRHQGTPGYAPQEQYPGGSGTDVRSDVYALGATLYFALIAQEPPSVSARNQSIQQGQPDLPSLQEQLAKNPPEDSPEANAARQFRLGVTKPGRPTPRHSRHLAQLGALPPELLTRLNLIIQRAMAMKPKDRYQTVADFANDLKKVAAALPTPAPPQPPARVPDPHSTQPDLPQLYEAIQAAQDNPYQTSPDTNVGPVSAPQQAVQPQQYCPRCSAPLVSRAAFCPRCGTPLVGIPKASAPFTPKAGIPSTQAKQTPSSSSDEQATMTVPPRPKTITSRSVTPIRSQSSQPSSIAANGQRVVSRPIPRNVTTTATRMNPPIAQSRAITQPPPDQISSSNTRPTTTGFQIGPRSLIIIGLLVIMLLILMVVLLVNQAHHAQIELYHTAYGIHEFIRRTSL